MNYSTKRVEQDLEKRRALFLRVQETLAEDLPYISLWYPDNVIVASKSIKNLRMSATGTWRSLFDAYKEAP